MKTKIDFVQEKDIESFRKSLQASVDAIELNINNEVDNITVNKSDGNYEALIIYKTKSKEILNEVEEKEGELLVD